MSVQTAARAPARQAYDGRTTARVLTAAVVRRVRRGTAVVALVAGGFPGIVVGQYRGLGGAAAVASLAALAESPAIRTLFGPPVGLDDAGGFTVWRIGTALAVLVGVWAALAATRVTRGEEEAGRWDLLLAGPVRLPSLVARHLAVLLAAAATIGATSALGFLLAGTAPLGAVLFGALLGGTGMLGAALGVLAAQLLPERRAASGLAVGTLLAGLLLRMIGDGVPALAWLLWVTPFGLLERSAPFVGDRPLPLLVLAVLVALPAFLAVALARRRDTGSGVLRGPEIVRAPGRLHSLAGLAVRRVRRPVLTWGAGLVAYFLLVGLLATGLTDFLRANPFFAEQAAQAGFANLTTVEGYAAALFTLLAVPVGAFAAGRLAEAAADEEAGRLALLLALPVARVRWATTEAAAATGGAAILAVLAGGATWAGTTWVGAPLSVGEALAGTLNVLPVALLSVGAALAGLGWAPSAVLPLGLLPGAGGYLFLLLADTFGWPGWIRGLSPFAHLAQVPAAPVDLAGAAGMVAVAAALAAVGLLGYTRRDLRG